MTHQFFVARSRFRSTRFASTERFARTGRPNSAARLARELANFGRRSLVLSAVLGGFGTLACNTGPGAKSPEAAIETYATALQNGDARAAYAALSVETQRRVPFARFEAMLRENPEQVAALAKRLHQTPERLTVKATFAGNADEVFELTLEDGQWKAELSAIDLYSQATPVSTVRSFVKAFEQRRYDVLLRFVPDSEKEGLTAKQLESAWGGPQKQEMTDLVAALSAALPTAKAEQYGDKASVAYGSGGTVELVEEGGLWKIVNF